MYTNAGYRCQSATARLLQQALRAASTATPLTYLTETDPLDAAYTPGYLQWNIKILLSCLFLPPTLFKSVLQSVWASFCRLLLWARMSAFRARIPIAFSSLEDGIESARKQTKVPPCLHYVMNTSWYLYLLEYKLQMYLLCYFECSWFTCILVARTAVTGTFLRCFSARSSMCCFNHTYFSITARRWRSITPG